MGGKKDESIKEIVAKAKAGRNWDIGCYWDFRLFGCGNKSEQKVQGSEKRVQKWKQAGDNIILIYVYNEIKRSYLLLIRDNN